MARRRKKWGAAPIALVGSALGAKSARRGAPLEKITRMANGMPAQVRGVIGGGRRTLGRRHRRSGPFGQVSKRGRDLERLVKIAGTVGAVVGAVSTGAEAVSEFRRASQSGTSRSET